MFRSIFLKTLRDYRIAVLGWGVGMGLGMVELIAAVSALISTPQQRAELAALATQFSWNADPVGVDTPGGYAMWKMGISVFVICVWPILAASRMLRGEEETSRLDVLLTAPRSRPRVALEKVAAIWTALFLIGLIIGLMTYAADIRYKDFGLGDALLWGLNIVLICMVFGGLALFISQFTRERTTAAGATGALLVAFIVLDMLRRVIPGTEWISRLSPVYYFNLSKPLVPSHGASAGGMLVQLVLAVMLTGAAIWLFVRRDVGDVVALPGRLSRIQRERPASAQLPVQDWSLRSVYTRSLGQLAMPTFWWTLVVACMGGFTVVVVEQMASKIQDIGESSPFFKQLMDSMGGAGAAFNDSLLNLMFFYMPVLIMAFAVSQVNRWETDVDEGRLEMVLATPQPRQAVILGRFAALATSTVVITLVTLAAILIFAAREGVSLNSGNIAVATLGLIPMALFVAAIGYFAGGWLTSAADTGLLSFLMAAWFFISFIGPDLKWPENALKLSPFYYYGTPILHGLQTGNMLVIVLLGIAALVLATIRFTRRDLAA